MYYKYLKIFWGLLEGVELLKLMGSWKPLAIVIANLVVGILVSQGFVDSASRDEVANLIAEIVGYLIILATSIATLIHAFRRPQNVAGQQPTVTQTVKTEIENVPVSTPQQPMEASLPSGTPPVINEQ